jgi:gas vesicle protein
MDILNLFVGAILGAFIGLVVAVIFEDKFRSFYGKMTRKWRGFISNFRETEYLPSQELFKIGDWVTNCGVTLKK